MNRFCKVLWILLLFAGVTLADDDISADQVPAAVMKTFRSVYPDAEQVEYERKQRSGETVYKIEFRHRGLEREIVYGADGRVIRAKLDD